MRFGLEESSAFMEIFVCGILFDMDGILISSIGSVERSWKKWGEMRGLDGGLAIKAAHGKRAIDTIRLLRPDLDDREELELIENLEIADKDDLRVLDGVQRLLEQLPATRWAIVTSATERLARVRLEHAGIPVPEQMITGDMVTHGKPHPEPYLSGAELLGCRPEDCLVIEDSTSGAKAGREAGCKVLATLFTDSAESLSAADWIVQSLADVKAEASGDGVKVEFTPITRVAAAR
jgi:sugar-phosphatase